MQGASSSTCCGPFSLYSFNIFVLIYNWFSFLQISSLPSFTVCPLCPSGVHGQREVPLRKWLWCFPQEARRERQRLHRLREDRLPVWRPEEELQRGSWQVTEDQTIVFFYFLFGFQSKLPLRSGLQDKPVGDSDPDKHKCRNKKRRE